MTKFKTYLTENSFQKKIESPSVSVTLRDKTLHLRFDSKDLVAEASYEGSNDFWLASLCGLILNKSVAEISSFTLKTWEEKFKDDQLFWDLRTELGHPFFFAPLELLHAALDILRGREELYYEQSPLICRCFGAREEDVLSHLKNNETPTLDSLAGENKAGMGCRSCVPQLERWLVLHEKKERKHFYKERPVADWLVDIDYMVSCFPKAQDWKMEVTGMKGAQVSISFDKEVSQREEEAVAKELQDFLSASIDSDLGFFLRRARHFSKAKG
jgi:hypothetical protein